MLVPSAAGPDPAGGCRMQNESEASPRMPVLAFDPKQKVVEGG
jgi:hypothetical protein